MKRTMLVATLIMLFVLTAMACPGSAMCPGHNQSSYYTGNTVTMGGHLWGEYQCPNGHTFLVRCD